jgi:hypothetical protein
MPPEENLCEGGNDEIPIRALHPTARYNRSESMLDWIRSKALDPASLFLLPLCLVILAWTAVVPVTDAFRSRELILNEGWNVGNAQKVTQHLPLYPATPDWTPINYPALSFHLSAALEKVTGDYLFTARFLSIASLCLCGIFVALIVFQTGRSRFAAWLSGLFLVAVFCADARSYVGMDDPQMLAQVFYLAGLYIYVKGNSKGWSLELAALLFVIGGNVKHNLIEFPLAVLLDLLFSAPRKALRFAIVGLFFGAVAMHFTLRIDGPAFISNLLAPRAYSHYRAHYVPGLVLKPILLSVVAALFMVLRTWRNPSQRVLAILLLVALPINIAFCGGNGVWINAMFGSLIAIVLLIGIFWADFPSLPAGPLKALPVAAVCAIFFLSLAIPMKGDISWGIGSIRRAMQSSRAAEDRYAAEVAFLRLQPGPALCFSPLRCYSAGKPYLYDAFNAPRWIALGKLDADVMVQHLQNRDYSAVQLTSTVESQLPGCGATPQCVRSILLAIQQNYRPAFQDKDCVIYLPNAKEPQQQPAHTGTPSPAPRLAGSKP